MRNKRLAAIQCIKNIHNSYKYNSQESSSVGDKSQYGILEDSSTNTDTISLKDDIENVIEEIPDLIFEKFNSVHESDNFPKSNRKYFSIENAALFWRAKNQNSNNGLSLLEWSFKKNLNYFNELSQSDYWADKILTDIDIELEIFQYLKEAFFPNRGYLVDISKTDKKREILGSLGKISILKDENELIHEVLLPCDSTPVLNPVVDQHGIFINSGSYIKKMSWAPINAELHTDQYLAVSVYKAPTDRSNFYESGISPNQIIQIYNCGPLTMKTKSAARAQLEMILTHDWGKITDMAWSPQPLPAVGRLSDNLLIGHLALCCTDGFIRIVPIGKPSMANCLLKLDSNHPVICLGAIRNKQNKEVFPVTMHWRQEFPDRIVAGYNTGHVGTFVLEACVFSSVARIIGVNIYLKPAVFHRVFHSPFRSIQISPFNWQLVSCSSMTMSNAVVVDLGQPSDMILPSPIDMEATIGSKIIWPIPGDVVVLAAGKYLHNKPGVLLCSAQKPAKRSRKLPLPDVSSIDLCVSLNILPIGTRSGQLRILSLNTNYVNSLLKSRSYSFKACREIPITSKFYLQYRLMQIDSNENRKPLIKSENGTPTVSSYNSCCSCPPKLQCVHKLSLKFSISVSKTPVDDRNNWQLDSMLNINEIATNPNPRCSTWIAVSLECGVIHIVPLTHFYRSELDQISTGSCCNDLNESSNQLIDESLLPKNIVYAPKFGRPRKCPRSFTYQNLYQKKIALKSIGRSIKSEEVSANSSRNLNKPLSGIRDFSLRSKSTLITDYFVNSSAGNIGLNTFQCSTPKRQKLITNLSPPKVNNPSKSKSAKIAIQRTLRSNSNSTPIQNSESITVPFSDVNMPLVASTRQRLRSFTGFNVDSDALVKGNELIETRSPSFETVDFGSSSLEKDADPHRKLQSSQKPLNTTSVGDNSINKLTNEISDMRKRTRSFNQLDKFMNNHSKSPGKSNNNNGNPVETSINIDPGKKRNRSKSFESSDLNISVDNKSIIKPMRERLRSSDRPNISHVTRSDINPIIDNKSIAGSMRQRNLSNDQSGESVEKFNNNEKTSISIDQKSWRNKSISFECSDLNISEDKISIDSIRMRTRSHNKSDNDMGNFSKSPMKTFAIIDLEVKGNQSISCKTSDLNKTINNNKSITETTRQMSYSIDQSDKSPGKFNNNNGNPVETSINIDPGKKRNRSISFESSDLNISIDNKSIIKPMRDRLRSFDRPNISLVTRSDINPIIDNKSIAGSMRQRKLSIDLSDESVEKFNNNNEKPPKTSISIDKKSGRNKSKDSIRKQTRSHSKSDNMGNSSKSHMKTFAIIDLEIKANQSISCKSSDLNKTIDANKSIIEPMRKRTRSINQSDNIMTYCSKSLAKSNNYNKVPVKTSIKTDQGKPRNRSISCESSELNISIIEQPMRLRSFDVYHNSDIPDIALTCLGTSITIHEDPVKLPDNNNIKSLQKRKKSMSNEHSQLNSSTEPLRKRLRSSEKRNPLVPADGSNDFNGKIEHSLRNRVYSFSSDNKLNMKPAVVLENLNLKMKSSPIKKVANKKKLKKIDKIKKPLLTNQKTIKITKNPVKILKINETIENESKKHPKSFKIDKDFCQIQKDKEKASTKHKEIKKNQIGKDNGEIKETAGTESDLDSESKKQPNSLKIDKYSAQLASKEIAVNPARKSAIKDMKEYDQSRKSIVNEETPIMSINYENVPENDIERTGIGITEANAGSSNKELSQNFVDLQILNEKSSSHFKTINTNETSYKKPVPLTPFRRFLNTDIDEEDESDSVLINFSRKSTLSISSTHSTQEKINKIGSFDFSESHIDFQSTPKVSDTKEKSEIINKNKISRLNVSGFLSISHSTPKISEAKEESEKINKNKISFENDKKSISISEVNKNTENIDKNKISSENAQDPIGICKADGNTEKINKISRLNFSELLSQSTPKASEVSEKHVKIKKQEKSIKKSLDDSKTELKKSKLQKASDERLQKLQVIMNSKRLALLNSQSTNNNKIDPVTSATTSTALVTAPTRKITTPNSLVSTQKPLVTVPNPLVTTPTSSITAPTPLVNAPTPKITTQSPVSSVKSNWWGVNNKVDDLYLKTSFTASPKWKSIINTSCEDRMDKIKQVINRGLSQSNSDCLTNDYNNISNNSNSDFPELLQPFRPLKASKSINTSLSIDS